LHVIATSGAILELYRQIASALGLARVTTSKALMTSMIRAEIKDLVSSKKLKPILIIDEASLLRLEVFAELHTLLQFEQDAKPYLPVILVGQASIIDKLSFRNSSALASRVITRCHLEGLNEKLNRYFLSNWRLAILDLNKGCWLLEPKPALIPYLKAENANGMHILIQPKDPSTYLLADDLSGTLLLAHHKLPDSSPLPNSSGSTGIIRP
jgi:hypothetical protein